MTKIVTLTISETVKTADYSNRKAEVTLTLNSSDCVNAAIDEANKAIAQALSNQSGVVTSDPRKPEVKQNTANPSANGFIIPFGKHSGKTVSQLTEKEQKSMIWFLSAKDDLKQNGIQYLAALNAA